MARDRSSKMDELSRRTIISGLGTASVLGVSSLPVAAKNDPDHGKPVEVLAERYGKAAAKAGIKIINRFLKQKKKKGYSHSEFHQRVTNALLDHPVASVIAKDVQQSNKSLKSGRDSTQTKTDTVTTSEVTTSSTPDSLGLGTVSTSTDQSGLGYSSAEFVGEGSNTSTLPLDKAKIRAGVPTYGTAQAKVRVYTLFYPENTGTYQFSTDYYRKGDVTGGATGKVSVYADPGAGGSETIETLEKPLGNVEGYESQAASLGLKSGEGYFIGIEYYASASSSTGTPLVDFRDSSENRRFEPNRNGPDTPQLDVTYFG